MIYYMEQFQWILPRIRYISEDDGTQEQSGLGQLLQGGQCLGSCRKSHLEIHLNFCSFP